jgi:hypothetical protein
LIDKPVREKPRFLPDKEGQALPMILAAGSDEKEKITD